MFVLTIDRAIGTAHLGNVLLLQILIDVEIDGREVTDVFQIRDDAKIILRALWPCR